MVIGYWLQTEEGQESLEAQKINNELKNLGYGVKNITSAMTDLMERKPRLVRQVAKSGSSRQARKKYKLTQAGIRKVQGMLAGEPEGEE